jgi:hypothetical protein
VPRLLPATGGRLQQRHFLEHPRGSTEQSSDDSENVRVVRERGKAGVVSGEGHELPGRVEAFGGCQGVEDVLGPLFVLHVSRRSRRGESLQGSDRIERCGRRERPTHREETLTSVALQLRLADVGQKLDRLRHLCGVVQLARIGGTAPVERRSARAHDPPPTRRISAVSHQYGSPVADLTTVGA